MNIWSFYKIAAWGFVGFSMFLLLKAGINTFSQNYNEHLSFKIEKVDKEISVLEDSISDAKLKLAEFNRIYKLSITQPLTPEHVRGEDLRAVIEGAFSIEVWLLNKQRYLKFLKDHKQKIQDSLIDV
jgi:hypothetical protein